jgi:hypothetical protein
MEIADFPPSPIGSERTQWPMRWHPTPTAGAFTRILSEKAQRLFSAFTDKREGAFLVNYGTGFRILKIDNATKNNGGTFDAHQSWISEFTLNVFDLERSLGIPDLISQGH